MTPLEIACRLCVAQPQEPCHEDDWSWNNNLQKDVQPECATHDERVFDAETWNSNALNVDKSEIEKAANDLI